MWTVDSGRSGTGTGAAHGVQGRAVRDGHRAGRLEAVAAVVAGEAARGGLQVGRVVTEPAGGVVEQVLAVPPAPAPGRGAEECQPPVRAGRVRGSQRLVQ